MLIIMFVQKNVYMMEYCLHKSSFPRNFTAANFTAVAKYAEKSARKSKIRKMKYTVSTLASDTLYEFILRMESLSYHSSNIN